MECSFVPWEESTECHVDGDVSIHGASPPHLFVTDDEIVTDQEVNSQAFEASPIFKNSLEAKMMEMMNLDTTGQDFVISENVCVDTEGNDEELIKHITEEPKMCNEQTATYWTGGGVSEGHRESQGEEEPPSLLNDTQLDVDQTVSHLSEDTKSSHRNTRIYLPLEKTLRNLRLLDLKLEYNRHQFAMDNPEPECNNDSSSSSDESNSKFPQSTTEEANRDEEAHHVYLINLLTQCHYKLEQMEELRIGSSRLAWRLWEAETTIENLKEKVAELQRENVKKEEEIYFLTEELMKTRRIFQQKMERAIDERMNILHPKSLTLHSRHHEFEPICIENDYLEENNQKDQNASKICVIL